MLSETSSEACDNTGCCVRVSPPSLTTITAYPSLSCQLYEFKLSITWESAFTAISAADLTGLKINSKKTSRHGNKQLTRRNFLNYFTSSLLIKTCRCRYLLRHSKLYNCRRCSTNQISNKAPQFNHHELTIFSQQHQRRSRSQGGNWKNQQQQATAFNADPGRHFMRAKQAEYKPQILRTAPR